jgi:hypothetical protein
MAGDRSRPRECDSRFRLYLDAIAVASVSAFAALR